MGFLRAPSHFVPRKAHGTGMVCDVLDELSTIDCISTAVRESLRLYELAHTHKCFVCKKKNRFKCKLELIECHRQLHIPSHRHIQKERRTHTHTPKHVYWIFMKYEYFQHTRYVMTRSDTTCAWISGIRLFCAVWNQSKWNASWKVCLDETEWITTSTHTESMLWSRQANAF